MKFKDAQDFCYQQNTPGLVVWDSEEKYNDVFFIAGIDGEDKIAWTALTNPDKVSCNPPNQCTNQLVRFAMLYYKGSIKKVISRNGNQLKMVQHQHTLMMALLLVVAHQMSALN